MYLANRGYRVANYALVPNVEFPLHLLENTPDLFVVGLTTDAKRLSMVRRNRLQHMSDSQNETYADLDNINDELKSARNCFLHKIGQFWMCHAGLLRKQPLLFFIYM